ncbi:MAG TPA: RNA polymerase sporulation sigma factor SigH, partial [Clostridiales bacterium]|nr:RNA polymerase sporulation sigma factor SigH [Clostridiales bacterium]
MNIIYEQLNDEDLVQMGRNGDSMAAEHLLTRYKAMVNLKTRAYFLVGADRDDLIQEGMIGLFKAMRDFNDTKNCKFGYFAELCVTRQIITAVKSATRRKHSPLNTYISLNKPVYEDESQTTYGEMISSGECDPEVLVL